MQGFIGDEDYIRLLAAREHAVKAIGLLFDISNANPQNLVVEQMSYQNRSLLSKAVLDKQFGIDGFLDANLAGRN